MKILPAVGKVEGWPVSVVGSSVTEKRGDGLEEVL